MWVGASDGRNGSGKVRLGTESPGGYDRLCCTGARWLLDLLTEEEEEHLRKKRAALKDHVWMHIKD